ncbi:hypothetical protein OH807_35380 [Kitasatospora sp. NBC_01560]|uniref:hypothetical protein n=1 Tax=Kitasatospora sp. NBC_01560 TaxID=2975965 RepID=UPI003870199E
MSASKLSELLKQFRCDDLEESVRQLSAALEVDPEATFGITFPQAGELLDTYRYRYSMDEIRDSRRGWDGFFSVLEGKNSPIGMVPVKIGKLAAIMLFDEGVESVLSMLIGSAE